jgi:hypothetical protein
MKAIRSPLLLVFLCVFAAQPQAQAVNPPPDGAYPGGNTAEGQNALFNTTTGSFNAAVGFYSLFGNAIGSYNTAVGAGALDLNVANNNTAIGAASLLLNTTGSNNTGTGTDALASNNSGIQNTATGAFALFANTTGSGNIAIGYQAGSAQTSGNNNIDIGNIGVPAESNTIRIGDSTIHAAIFVAGITAMSPAAPNQAVLIDPATGQLGGADVSSFGVVVTDPENTAVGDQALASNTGGGSNTATGFRALFSNTDGAHNTATGAHALENNDTGVFNNAFGALALASNVNGFSNNAMGDSALFENIHGTENTAFGDLALSNNDATGHGQGNFNTAVGAEALFNNTDGDSNNAIGAFALHSITTGSFNQAMGYEALHNNVDGFSNVAIGDSALSNSTAGSSNVVVGDSAGQNVITASHVICIGANVAGENVSNTCYIGNIFGVTSAGGLPVFVNADGKLGTVISSRRFKEKIKPMEHSSEALFALKPVTFHYTNEIDPAGTSQFGLVAEEVEKVNPDLVVRDKEGEAYSVRYDQVNAMLLNEFLKEHRKVQGLEAAVARQQACAAEHEATIARQQKQIEALIAEFQKVSERLEPSETAPQKVLNDR